ncbi:flavodoxin family protein [Chloroflexota bacterium]|nr:flavodoxin family protein [Chloroflexota bacterium]
MNKILVLYHSQQFGHLHMMAEAFAEGIQKAGGEATLHNTNHSRYNIEEYRQFDGVAIGSPDYFSYIAGTLKTFLDDWFLAKSREPQGLTHKPYVLFLSYDHVGQARQALEMLFSRLGTQVGSIVECDGEPDEATLAACRELGAKIVQAID